MITHAYLDLDGVPHLAASVAEKANYQWLSEDETEQSEVLKSAEAAADWRETQHGFGLIDMTNWKRKTIVDLKSSEFANKAVHREMKSWMDSIIQLTGNPNIIFKGFLSASGRKSKDLDHLEQRYQHNRYKCKETWTPLDKKVHLQACRDHLLSSFDFVSLGPPGIEADAIVIFLAENRGKKAVMGIKDKDLQQSFDTYYINMNKSAKKRKLEETTRLGEVCVRQLSSSKELGGTGFKFILGQTICGDTADGYAGVKGYGPVKVVALLDKVETIEEGCEVLLNAYRKKFPKGHKYVDWNGVEQERTAEELCIQHCQLAYHERGGKDLSNPIERYLNGLPPIYQK